MKIIIYTQDSCTHCNSAKREFETKGWEYTSHNITDTDNYNNLQELLPGIRTVPQIWIDDKHIGGYDDLMEWMIEFSHV